MQIAIIGAGNVGMALGQGWSRAGHQIIFGVRDPAHPRHEKNALQAGSARVTSVALAVASAEIIVLAVPWDGVPAALEACGNLNGRVLIDATNPLRMGSDGLELAIGFTHSGGEEVAFLAKGAKVFKTMNQVGFPVMADTSGYVTPPVMFVAGDDGDSKPTVLALIASLGFEAVDAGPLRNSRLLEPYAMVWIDQAMNRGAATTNAFAMLKKDSGT